MSHQQALAQVTAQAALAAQSQMYMQAQFQQPSVSGPAEVLPVQPSYTGTEDSHSVDKPSDDGYNWRKYGHKPIKGSEYPRSYYKCTHPNCPVKKKVERSGEGQISEIIYKGQHNHEVPQSSKRARDNSDQNVSISSQSKNEHVPQSQPGDSNNLNETRPSYSESGRDQESRQMGPTDQPEPKAALPHKTVTDAKIIVQTRSEVDLLDDGFRWRKYGQKVVKGNPHPRSYYKCTSAGCNVRKHVERAAADPKAVITTYEGKHNHDVPAGRNSSHNKLPSMEGMNYGNNEEQRPVLLRLKEEEVVV
ncbi:Probable WRKY transcription factor 3 [Linum perenne]